MQFVNGEYFHCRQSTRKEGATKMRRIVLVLVLLFVLALTAQASVVSMAAPRWEGTDAPRWEQSAAPRWERTDAPRWE
jgi:hypothetical protein